MTKLAQKTTASALLGTPVLDASGVLLGRVRELVVRPALDPSRVSSLLPKLSGPALDAAANSVAVEDLELTPDGLKLHPGAQLRPLPDDPALVLLERDLLDQQIIDVHGHKVVRVNDVDLVWEHNGEPNGNGGNHAPLSLRITEVEVGARGAVRRLLKGLPRAAVESLAQRITPSVIPWDFVDLIDPSRRVRLKVDQDRLSQIHPSDLADILEDLAPPERHALFTSLDEEVAAETLEEVEPKLQKSLLESLDSGQVADIVEEMDPGAAADLLNKLPEDRSEAILEKMEPEEREEVEELLEFSGNSAAGRMTTEYVAVPEAANVSDALNALASFEGDLDLITDIYLLDKEERITGIVPVVRMLLSPPQTPLAAVPHGHLVTCGTDASGRKVAELFDKYNLRSLPVVDEDQHLVGVVHAEQVIALLRETH
ncbi:magnesium transporter MgtE N-terminal domain-containing protein [Edaphobacter bradus]|uniref:magnesium transporter MgtE N-terminal domain-containing protein n=1 Tax=Edaphobacter bradus TaxID=2259016 RepID=UPI0021E00318|nr:CBS domain-containing protein [Edaphobacter bradus]